MARRRRAEKRTILPDPKYNNLLISRFINNLMERGKKGVAEKVIYQTLENIADKTKKNPIEIFEKAIQNVKPELEVKSRRVGGATYQVPMEVRPDRAEALAIRWIITFARARKGEPMDQRLTAEILDAFNNQGNAIKKREDTHKMADANRAFAHFRW